MKHNYHAPFTPTTIYHLYNRSNNREVIFPSNRNVLFFLRQFYRYLHPYVALHAFVIMKTHFHFLIRVREVDERFFTHVQHERTAAADRFLMEEDLNTFLEDQFKRFFCSYSKAFNKAYERHGSLFQKRFKRIEVQDMDYFSELVFYIHQNPVKDGYTRLSHEWAWSSRNLLGMRRGLDLQEIPTLIDFVPREISAREATRGMFHLLHAEPAFQTGGSSRSWMMKNPSLP